MKGDRPMSERHAEIIEAFFGWKIADGYSEMMYNNVEKHAYFANVKLYMFTQQCVACLSV